MRFNAIRFLTKTLWTIFILGLLGLGTMLSLVGFNLKHITAAFNSVTTGRVSLERALEEAQTSDFSEAKRLATEASRDFNVAVAEIKSIRLGPFRYIPLVAGYKADAEHLVEAGHSLAQAMEQATAYAYGLGDIISANSGKTFTQLPIEERRRILASVYTAEPALGEVNQHLTKSLEHLDAIRSFAWFGPLSARLEDVREKIGTGQRALEEASPLTRLLPSLLGYPETSDYLLILQNSDELRPTGGFIGTYGIVQAKDGDFSRFETHDIYHIDMPVRDKINVEPPEPIKKYLVQKWYMRDANWSPDWPTAAEQILWFYKAENAALPQPDPLTDFDGVIAITPEFIVDLLRLTGPIELEGETYTPENFVDLLQYKVEQDFVRLGIPSWHRKEVIGDIAKTVKQRLFDLPLGRWPEIIDTVSDNVARKNILLYSKDPNLQKLIVEQGWSGAVRQEWGDYLMVVDANLAALKTDAVMDRQISYRLEEKNGRLSAVLTLNYSHRGGFDWKTTRYRTYTRVFVPAGSRLTKASGFSEGDVKTGEELGKTWFGAFLSVEPGQIGQLVFEYELPEALTQNMKKYGNYRLIVQKQPGKQISKLTVDVGFENEIKSYSPANFYAGPGSSRRLTAEGDLTIDRSFLVNF